ncbi:Concanavalin A-like lectin/glucanases superfamily [uncultured Caudovirales phage]|uniref:Concanavalin A-like lectin/glucanases superfamily n=1 Tax=uncultured Caudovirales phage TaxID=2100421 RepID=A0A6J7WDX3_9CAUD|nr:Concanavalin A-like lectin/glucanases superfamily [uncultured Caudovirales phage]CAB5209212.1 Concanavalin A-like lectin/glucanases superfamily [uncultured Caudovirales phage]
MAEFKIGRLRFTWAGEWTTGTFYNRDAVASYNGKTYVCLTPHTSTDFYDDLYHVEPSDNSSSPYWTLMVDGTQWKQDWEPDTYYSLGNIVKYGGIVYLCTTQHTSGSSQIDLANWSTYASFDNWHTSWNPSTVYGIGDVVKYGGIVYRCTTNHVSAVDTATGLEVDQSNWAVVNNGIEYKGAWSSAGYRYRLNDIVKKGAGLWICTQGHTSTSTFDQAVWTVWLPGEEYSGTWSSGAVYQPGDVVQYGGYSYLSLTANNTNHIPSTDSVNWTVQTTGYEMMNNWSSSTQYKIGDIVRRNGRLFSAVQDNSAQDPSLFSVTSYYNSTGSAGNTIITYSLTGIAVGSMVIGAGFTQGQSVVSTTLASAVNPTISNATVTVAATGIQATNQVTVTDATGIVIGMSVTGTGLDTGVTVSNVSGTTITLSINNIGPVANNLIFGANAITVSNATGIAVNMSAAGTSIPLGAYVTSVVSTTIILSAFTTGTVSGTGTFGIPTVTLNTPPDGTVTNGQSLQFVGINYLYWQLVVPGVNWTKFWTIGTTQIVNNLPVVTGTKYVIGDLAVWKNQTYRCIQNHDASVVGDSRPDLDTSNRYWTVYTRHAVKNALTYPGDIVTYNGTGSAPLSIGTNDYILTANSKQPAWRQINTSTKLYYVAPNGVDSAQPGQGLTWDRPWKTIAYACSQALNGTLNPNTGYLLTENKSWLTTEMYQYMLYQKANSNAPFSPGSVFDQTKTIRDASYVVDAIIYDLTRGGNSQSVSTALAYFKPGTTDTYFSTTVAAEMPYFIAALNYLSTIIPAVINNQPPQIYQQVRNGIQSAFSTNATVTEATTDYITVGNTSLMTVGQAINFAGIGFGNIDSATTYYIKSIINSTTITISETSDLAETFDLIDGSGNLVATGTGPRIAQTIDLSRTAESGASQTASTLINIIISALTTQSTTGIPASNAGITSTINIKTGTYHETLPIIVPSNTALVGDELRGTVVYPKVIINTVAKAAGGALFTVLSTTGMYDGCPIQFAAATVFGGITAGQTYYVIGDSISSTQFAISATLGSTTPVTLTSGTGTMSVYGGDAIKNMFLVRNGSGIRNMTMNGLLGTLGAQNQYLTKRPTGGAYVSLDPGNGPDDTSTWITKRSPYMQNCSMFGQGCIGMKVDGSLHNGGNKSIVANDFTTILSDGIGAWVTNSGALSELVSVFSYYGYAGYFAENGGRIRATNGNTSYGSYGCIAEGYDNSEVPISATVDNRVNQASAQVQSSFGTNANLLKLQYSNAGSDYVSTTTNLNTYSNNFLTNWTTDGNILLQQNAVSPTSYSDGWTLTGTSSSASSSYIYQSTIINPTGAVYTAVSGSNITGSGTGASFDVTVGATAFSAVVNVSSAGGTGYINGNLIKIFGSQVGGIDGVNDITLTVSVSGSSVSTVTAAGTVPAGSALSYTLSLHVKKSTATSIDLQGIYSGNTTVTSGINFNFDTKVITPSSDGIGLVPTLYGVQTLNNGWYRIWFSIYDTIALNNSLQLRIFPKGVNGAINTSSSIYGAQTEIGTSPNFFLTTSSGKYTSYADYIVNGAGTGAVIIADEIRSGAVFETRVTDLVGITGTGGGGSGYLTASNNAQGGTTSYIALAGSDNNTATNYVGMRVFINSGTGAGQYGYISNYNPANKFAYVLKETFTPVAITTTSSGTNLLTLSSSSDVNTLYLNQPVQFIPTYYNTTVISTSKDALQILSVTGGTFNFLTTTSTERLALNMPVTFTGTTFGGITTGYTFYVINILNSTDFQISTSPIGEGEVWLLTTGTGTGTMNVEFPSGSNYLEGSTTNMLVNMPIQFSGASLGGLVNGTLYYINDVISSNLFTVSTALTTVTATATDSGTKKITVGDSTTLIALNPIVFSGTMFGGLVSGGKYYISKIVDTTHIQISSTLIYATAISTTTSSNIITLADGFDTSGFVINNPIKFVGKMIGGLTADQIYYVLAINDSSSFAVSTAPGGSAVNLATATGYMTVVTSPTANGLTTDSGSMTGTSTVVRSTLIAGAGSMNAIFSTSLFGGVVAGTTYYILAINTGASNTIQITDTLSGSTPVTLTSNSGSMQLGQVGWDNVNPGTPAMANLDSTSVYYIEPRPLFGNPGFAQSSTTLTTQALGTAYTGIKYGAKYWIAIANGNATASGSPDGINWTPITLPVSSPWSGIAYGNNYWIIISQSAGGADTGSRVIYSASNGLGWRISYLPTKASWSSVTYGNGTFVAVASGTSSAAYSTNFGGTWTQAVLPATGKTGTIGGTATISSAQSVFGNTSLSLPGSSYVNFASHADYGYSTGNFTIECQVRFNSIGAAQCIIDQRTTATEYAVLFEISATGAPRLFINGAYVITHQSTISATTWTHVAVVRSSGVTTIYLNGIGSTTTYTDTNNYAARPVRVGAYYTGTASMTGYVDELRISKGTARYTANFNLALPSAPFTLTTSETTSLFHFDAPSGSTNITAASTWSSVTYGGGKFVAVGGNGSQAAYSTDGITWTSSTLPTSGIWGDVVYGNGSYVAINNVDGTSPAISFNGSTWTSSPYTITANSLEYGQGVFLAVSSAGTTAYTSEDGILWTRRTVSNDGYTAMGFGYASSTNTGLFVTVAGQSTGSLISAGCQTKGRPTVVSGRITGVTLWEPGSGYTSAPSTSFFDPNVTSNVTTTTRIGNGALGAPSFINRGVGYNTSSTVITINGNGYADIYQTGLSMNVNNLTLTPRPGDNLVFAGNSTVYKVTNATVLNGTTAPNITATIQISPDMTVNLSPANGVDITIRQKYSQCRLTGHDFLNIGFGNIVDANYPGLPADPEALAPANQAIETNYGRVFYTSTDQDGNFLVGLLFGVQQATGIVTLSATQFGLTGLDKLSLGGISVGGSGVVISQFSTDQTFVANSNTIIPTQRAIRGYLTGRLSQGGSNVATGQATAGTVVIGGPDKITNTIPQGTPGSSVKMLNKVNMNGALSGVGGNMLAENFFMKQFSNR